MKARLSVPLRVAAVAAMASVVGVMSGLPATADSNAPTPGAMRVVNTETVQVYTDAVGAIETQRIYEQLAVRGKGTVDVRNPVDTDGLRNLDGFGGFDVEGGEQVATLTVDGEKHLRTVSDYSGKLPLDVSVEYFLDGKQVDPGDVVGESGKLEVKYTVKNVTAAPQQVTFDDGKGGTVTKTVDVPIPIVGSLTTVAPSTFTNVTSADPLVQSEAVGDEDYTTSGNVERLIDYTYRQNLWRSTLENFLRERSIVAARSAVLKGCTCSRSAKSSSRISSRSGK